MVESCNYEFKRRVRDVFLPFASVLEIDGVQLFVSRCMTIIFVYCSDYRKIQFKISHKSLLYEDTSTREQVGVFLAFQIDNHKRSRWIRVFCKKVYVETVKLREALQLWYPEVMVRLSEENQILSGHAGFLKSHDDGSQDQAGSRPGDPHLFLSRWCPLLFFKLLTPSSIPLNLMIVSIIN